MTDREMLELAAKAAEWQLCGYSWIGENEDDDECEILESAFVKTNPEQELATKWNPLTDDGDALRLAVSLGFIVDIDTEEHYTEIEFTSNYEDKSASEGHGFDATEATRRAITIAAAKIGKEMK